MSLARWSVSLSIVALLALSFPQFARGEQPESIAALTLVSGFATAVCWTAAIAEEGNESRDHERDPDAYARRGPLVGAALAYAIAESEHELAPASSNLSLKDSFGFKGHAGYRCHRYLAADFQAEWIKSFEGKAFPKGAGTTQDFDVQSLVFTSNVRAYLPLFGDRVQPFALAGGGLATMKTKQNAPGGPRFSGRHTEFAFRVGGGVDFYATPNVVLTFETDWLRPVSKLKDYDYLSVGLGAKYRF